MNLDRLLLGNDHAQNFLIPYLDETELIFRSALKEIDPSATCRIIPVADLGIPHDVIRIAGGFATGCFVEWSCRIPVVPVDTTVNIDTTSIFYLNEPIDARFEQNIFNRLRQTIESQSSYLWNFHKGNHFIAAVKRESDNAPALIIHSNEKEFKFQFNGLVPVQGNWFSESIRTFGCDKRPIRLLVGPKAKLFTEIAKMLEEFNIIRHRFICDQLIGDVVKVNKEYHKNHYFMPHPTAVAMGCYLCEEGEAVPILSQPGLPVDIFLPTKGGSNELTLLNGKRVMLVPHGWGKTCFEPLSLIHGQDTLTVNGVEFRIEPQISLGKHPGLHTRTFDTDLNSSKSFMFQMRCSCPGTVQDRFIQTAWYNKDGVNRINL